MFPFLLVLLAACRTAAPPKTIRLPPALREASGLSIHGEEFTWHNDSGDGPYLYTTNAAGELLYRDTLAAGAVDYEDLTRDAAGRFYLGDFGNNTGRRTTMQIYRYAPATRKTDTIHFTFPGQDGGGRDQTGNPDCEAVVWHGGNLHLFTKDQLFGKGSYYTYHYRLPAQPGRHEATLIDSLYLPRRVVTAAALDTVRRELVLTAYNFKFLAGFWPRCGVSNHDHRLHKGSFSARSGTPPQPELGLAHPVRSRGLL